MESVSRPPFKVSYDSQVHLFRIVPTLTFEMGKSHQFLEITKKYSPASLLVC